MRSQVIIIFFSVFLFNAVIAYAESLPVVVSPNSDLSMTIHCQQEGVKYSVKYKQNEIMGPSKLGLKFRFIVLARKYLLPLRRLPVTPTMKIA